MERTAVKLGTFLPPLALFLALTIIASTAVGPVKIPLRDVFSALTGLNAEKTGSINEAIILQIRLPRIILGMLVGCALAVAGAAMQGLFKNPMADPYVTGISSGAALGASIAIIAHASVPLVAFLCAIATVFLVYKIAGRHGSVQAENLLLSGIAVATFLSAMTSLVIYLAGEDLHQIIFWLMGGLWAGGWGDVKVAFPLITLGVAGIFAFSRELNVMLLGEEPAAHLGIDVERSTWLILSLVSLITAIAVSVSGIIGFVGLIIPHMARLVVGPDHRILIPACALSGAAFLVLTDTLARTVISPTELPLGILTALIGVPFFIYLLSRKKGGVFG
jgi:iron complex transport system permease protein